MLGDNTRGAHLVRGPAGSGKTTFLCSRYAELVRAGEHGILFLVGSRRTARTLQERILRELGRSTDDVRVATWHSYAVGLLGRHWEKLGYRREPALLTGPEQFGFVRDMLGEPAEQRHWDAFPKQRHLAAFVAELREFVLRAQDGLHLPEELEEKARGAGREDLAAAARFFRRYIDRLDARDDAVIDHANAIAQAWRLMTMDAEVADRVRRESAHVLVDDLHDATPAQIALLREITGSSVTATANPDARIFGFRGAAGDPVKLFESRFAPVQHHELTTRHRDASRRSAWLFDHLTEEADAVARECARLRARDVVPYGEIGIIVRRFGNVSRAIRRALERAGVPSIVVGENRPLVEEAALRPMLDVARLALRATDPASTEHDDLVRSVLSSPAGGLDPYAVRALVRSARLSGRTLLQTIEDPPPQISEDIAGKLRAITELLRTTRTQIEGGMRPDETFWFLWDSLEYFRDLVADEGADDLDAVAAFARAISRFSEKRPGKTFADYLDVLEGVDFGPEPWNMPEDRRPDAVRIVTAHNAAGMEFEAVIVAGCVEGEFPDPHERRSLFDIRDIVDPATPFERVQARTEDEQRLFGVAISRARMQLVLTAAREWTHGRAEAASPIVRLAGLEWERPPERPEPLTRDEAEAAARRDLRAGTAEQKEVALAVLAALPGVDPDTWWYESAWTDPGIPIADGELRTSYSRLSAYDNCALQYLYQVELGLDPESTHQMLVGTWVHDIVERVQRGEILATEPAVLHALDEIWDPNVFDSVALEHRRKLDSQEMLRRWLRIDANLDTKATEVAFEFPIDGAVIRGRIDRVVRLGTRNVRLIDYKTSRHAKSQEEIDEDLQLATYYLALTRVPELAELGTPKYLELAFLGAFYQDGFIRRGVDPTKDPAYDQKAQDRLEGFVKGIRAEEFAPTASANCQWCRFKTLCPVWPEGDEVKV